MKKRMRFVWWVIALPIVALASIVPFAFPFLAITEPSGAQVLVVEGWMDPGAMQEAAKLAVDSGYGQIYTTGSVRPFAYLMGYGDGIDIVMHDSAQGPIELEVVGNAGAGFLLMAGGDTLLNAAVALDPRRFTAQCKRPVVQFRFAAWEKPGAPGPALFIRSFTVDGMNVNYLQSSSRFTHPGSLPTEAWPTYAHSARSELIGMGLPPDRVTAVPAYGKPHSRSWGNAHAFGELARRDGITAFDVATSGVHARRSRNLFRQACGPGVMVGVIALEDPYCTRQNWWKSFRGWFTLLKEIVGAPEAEAVEIKRLAR